MPSFLAAIKIIKLRNWDIKKQRKNLNKLKLFAKNLKLRSLTVTKMKNKIIPLRFMGEQK